MEEKILKELKELNKTMSSIRTFIIAEVQLMKSLSVESPKQGRDIQKIKSMMEEDRVNYQFGKDFKHKLKNIFKKQ